MHLVETDTSFFFEIFVATQKLLMVTHFNVSRTFRVYDEGFNEFQLSAMFHIEANHLIYTANQMTGFYMKHSTRLKYVKEKQVRTSRPSDMNAQMN